MIATTGPGPPGSAVDRLLEVASLEPGTDAALLARLIADLGGQHTAILPPESTAPWLLVRTRGVTADQLAQALAPELPCAVTELHCRLEPGHDDRALAGLLLHCAATGRVIAGLAAVERAAQRRQLDILATASNIDKRYTTTLEKILTTYRPAPQVIATPYTTTELGALAYVRRAGCLGILRGHTSFALTGPHDQASRSRGRVVSSLPGSSSSAETASTATTDVSTA